MKIVNRKTRFNYEFLEKLEAGIALLGSEVKSVKKGQLSLDEAFIRIDHNKEAWLINAHIHPYQFANNKNYDPLRSRKLLLHKQEILGLLKKIEGKNLTIVPISCYTRQGKIKVELALAKGKKLWQKKEKIKERDLERDLERELKSFK